MQPKFRILRRHLPREPKMNKFVLLRLTIPAGLLLSSSLAAQGVEGVLNTHFDFGGDAMVAGNDVDLRAGELVHVNTGISIAHDARGSWATEVTVGYKFERASTADAELTWSRWPVEFMQYRRIGDIRMGGGLTYHLAPRLEGQGSLKSVDRGFDDAFGFVLQADYLLGSFNIGGRCTFIQYRDRGASLNANSVGFTLGTRF